MNTHSVGSCETQTAHQTSTVLLGAILLKYKHTFLTDIELKYFVFPVIENASCHKMVEFLIAHSGDAFLCLQTTLHVKKIQLLSN